MNPSYFNAMSDPKLVFAQKKKTRRRKKIQAKSRYDDVKEMETRSRIKFKSVKKNWMH